jgi:hypothetical protein
MHRKNDNNKNRNNNDVPCAITWRSFQGLQGGVTGPDLWRLMSNFLLAKDFGCFATR